MDFNPLDLLASAAELQQKHDDAPEVTMVTRRRYNSSSAVTKEKTVTLQKEYKDVKNNNNNNSIKSKGPPVIIRKIKVGSSGNPDLDKMLNEHNYGNAKRGHKFESKGIEVVLDNNRNNRERTESVSDGCSQMTEATNVTNDLPSGSNVDSGESRVSENENKGSDKSDDQLSNIECKCGKGTKTDLNVESKTEMCNDSCTCVCSTRDDKNEQELNCSKCNHMDCKCDCPRPKWEHTATEGQMMVNISQSDKTGGQNPDCVVNDNVHTSSPANIKRDTITIHIDNQDQRNDDVAKTNGITDVINKCANSGTELENNFTITKNDVCSNLNTKFSEISWNTDLTSGEEKTHSVNIDLSSSRNVNNIGKVSVQNDTTNLKDTVSYTTSEKKKTPYVKVVPAKAVTVNDTMKPQTLVINIGKRGQNSVIAKSTQNASISEINHTKCQKPGDDSETKIGIIRSLLTTDKINNGNTKNCGFVSSNSLEMSNVPQKPQFDFRYNISKDIGERLHSCDSLKSLEFEESLCSDNTSTSVHLLSPDRRNPDSMGIAESPVTYNAQDISCSGDIDSENEKVVEGPFQSTAQGLSETVVEFGAVTTVIDETSNVNEEDLLSSYENQVHSTPLSKSQIKTIENGIAEQELMKESMSYLESDKETVNQNKSDNCANISALHVESREAPIFRLESDHCYAGMPGKINNTRSDSIEHEQSSSHVDNEDIQTPVRTPLGSTGELSQDSGYEDVAQSPEMENFPNIPQMIEPKPNLETVKNLVPVLISVDSKGCLTVHKDTKGLSGQIFSLADNMPSIESGLKLFQGTNAPTPLILSPVGKNTSPVLLEPPNLAQKNTENILGLLHATSPDAANSNFNFLASPVQQVSPPKFGKFRIGTFASFSNTGMGIEENKNSPVINFNQPKMKATPSQKSRTSMVKTPPAVDTLSTLVQKVKNNLSSSVENPHHEFCVDHIQHDHDYCMKNLMPSVVNSVLESKLQQSKDTPKGKVLHNKLKKLETDLNKGESKLGKRKRANSIPVIKDEEDFELEEDQELNSSGDFRPKTRAERYIEQKSSEPKVKITGSSNFKDQFVYFMNTKKRNRRRESRESPMPIPFDKLFIPPKPGDIVVPHLTDQDIENLKIRSKNSKHNVGYNSLRNEYMATKSSNSTFSSIQPPASAAESSTDDEKNIINTILSMENENLTSPVTAESPYNESMEMYGQGLGGDMMNLLPEQMNLTQEQMDILLSAVDEVQNSSPGLVGSEKLVSSETNEAFTRFPIPPERFDNSPSSETASELKKTDASVGPAEPEQKDTDKSSTAGPETESKSETDGELKSDTTTEEASAIPSQNAETTVPSEPPGVQTEASNSTVSHPVEMDKSSSPDLGTESTIQPSALGSPESVSVAHTVVQDNEDTRSNSSFTLPESVPLTSESNSASDLYKRSFSVINQSATSAFSGLNADTGSNSDMASPEEPIVTAGSAMQPSSTANISNSINSEMQLSTFDKTPMEILDNDLRLDRNYMFSDSSDRSSMVQSVTNPAQIDYSAPWIVTVSMYWNDLPAIMIKNQPFVRLVDIHKQILPAKDTGILKKRCQLMGTGVENCSEMQRYFLVQYGRAFNSKSTLIISKEDAKELIGYYVDPQPKSLRLDDHKSIIDHRREQLRRIALARRAAMRASRVNGKKDDDPRSIKELGQMDSLNSTGDVTKSVEVGRVLTPGIHPPVQTPDLPQQRSTRHKKINFLEMLRGDTGNSPDDDNTTEENGVSKKQYQKRRSSADSAASLKKRKISQDKKVKVIRYTVETDSSETESNEESESDEFASSSDSESSCTTSDNEVVVVTKMTKKQQKFVNPVKFKSKPAKVKNVMKKSSLKVAPPLKVKFSNNRRISTNTNRSSSVTSPVTVQVVNKALGTLSAPVSIYRSKPTGSRPIHRTPSSESRSFSPPIIVSERSGISINTVKNGMPPSRDIKVQNDSCTNEEKINNTVTEPKLAFDTNKNKVFELNKIDVSELKVTDTLPDEILEEPTKTKEMETNTDFDSPETQENVNNIEEINQPSTVKYTSSEVIEIVPKVVASEIIINQGFDFQSDKLAESTTIASVNGDLISSPVTTSLSGNESRSQSPLLTDTTISGMKRKEIIHITNNEVSLRIVHRDASPQNGSHSRTRSQIGEIFVDRYSSKKSLCVRCYTCRKMLSVDSFMRHLHDIAIGGLIGINMTRTIDPSESDLNSSEKKQWEAFQRKKELFDNNQLPSPEVLREGMMCAIDSESRQSILDKINENNCDTKPTGPTIITTPVSPVKTTKNKNLKSVNSKPMVQKSRVGPRPVSKVVHPVVTQGGNSEAVRSSSRKRKMKQLYPMESYSFAKFPRLQNGMEDGGETTTDQTS